MDEAMINTANAKYASVMGKTSSMIFTTYQVKPLQDHLRTAMEHMKSNMDLNLSSAPQSNKNLLQLFTKNLSNFLSVTTTNTNSQAHSAAPSPDTVSSTKIDVEEVRALSMPQNQKPYQKATIKIPGPPATARPLNLHGDIPDGSFLGLAKNSDADSDIEKINLKNQISKLEQLIKKNADTNEILMQLEALKHL
jgi:hypothetical protein